MKTKIVTGLKTLLTVAGLSTAASCINESIPVESNGTGTERYIEFKMDIPVEMNKAKTYSISGSAESAIETIDVLAFKVEDNGDETFDYQAAHKVEATPNQFQVKVLVKTYQQRFVLITNAKTEVENLLLLNPKGVLKEDLLQKLDVSLAAGTKWNATGELDFKKLPMWGESEQLVITTSTTALAASVKMIRMVAKINVMLDNSTNANLFTDFQLKGVHVYNTALRGRVTPVPSNVNASSVATAVSMPDGWVVGDRQKGPLFYNDFSGGVADQSIKETIYTFEMPTDTDYDKRPCIVVQGHYGTDLADTYYRVDYILADKSYTSILRNHCYTINIVNVKGSGYSSVEEAYQAKPINLVTDILIWDEGSFTEVTTDGQYRLGVSKGEFTLPKTENAAAATVFIQTDYTNGWTINRIEDKNGVATWLKVDVTSGVKDDKTKVTIGLDENPSSSTSRVGYIYITAGRIEYRITVTQTAYADVQISIFNSLNDEIEELVFAAKDGVAPAEQIFKIVWFPATKACAINTTALTTPAFNYGTGANMATTTQTDATGAQTFTIAPAAITVSTDPFEERVSSVLVSLTSDGTTKTKNLLLRQVVKNIVVPSTMEVDLDGGTKSFAIKANVGWTLTHVASNDAGKEFITSYGITSSAGSVSGDTYSFGVKSVLAADLMTYANSSVTLTLVNSEFGITKPVVITPKTCGTNGNPGSFTVGSNTYKTHLYGTKCWMVENSKEGTPSGTTYTGHSIGERGYYYTWAQAAGACPSGWRLPLATEFADVVAAVSGANLNQPAGKWWAGSAAVSAFAGYYGSSTWYNWGAYGGWWSGSATGQYFLGLTGNMGGPGTFTGYWFSVRCVKQ